MLRLCFLAIACLTLLAAGARGAQAQYLSAYSTCSIVSPPEDSLYVIWTLYETFPPSYHPEWVGYDVLRRALPGCNEYVRANDQIIPREVGTTHTVYWGEANPASGTVFEYRVIPVDANRQELFFPGFCSPCNVYQECPPFSAPITVGALVEPISGWLFVEACPGTCYPAPFISPGPVFDQLQPYAGTGTTFRFFGRVGCGGVEGCSIEIDHWQFASCVTPATTQSWGRLKTIYR